MKKLRGVYLSYLLTNFNKLGYQINRLNKVNSMIQYTIKHLDKKRFLKMLPMVVNCARSIEFPHIMIIKI